jgi:hypothetical protein
VKWKKDYNSNIFLAFEAKPKLANLTSSLLWTVQKDHIKHPATSVWHFLHTVTAQFLLIWNRTPGEREGMEKWNGGSLWKNVKKRSQADGWIIKRPRPGFKHIQFKQLALSKLKEGRGRQ